MKSVQDLAENLACLNRGRFAAPGLVSASHRKSASPAHSGRSSSGLPADNGHVDAQNAPG